MTAWAQWIVCAAAFYFALGLLFAIAFVGRGVSAMDPVAKNCGWGFRVLIVPGVAALWPILAKRWLR